MNEQEHSSQLSALFDGQLPPQQAQMVIRRALREPAMRASWERYALIGACLRAEPIAGPLSVADRVQASIAAERELNILPLPARTAQARAAGAGRFNMLGRGALGGAIAAGVAVVSIVVMRAIGPTADSGALIAQGSSEVAAAPLEVAAADGRDSAPGSYITPGTNSPAQPRLVVDATLGHFLVAHSEEAASALRSSYDLVAGGIELTEDQISALR
ncbi:MAG TPA: sigma-E factor negative regulatory protein [Steroidobacteraceae bacterium]|nr:sigma-E factor negative regulatory protein [Steroidobacteraceae bacterium]